LSFIPITLIGAYYFAKAGLTFAELRGAGGGGGANSGRAARVEKAPPDDDGDLPYQQSAKPPAA
jgi:hypothetical protein